MNPNQFAEFYQAVHGYAAFPWQQRLAIQVAAEGWPAVLALPTAAGKTSAIDIAVFTLALQAGKPLDERTAPLRIFLVIDRRLVVDQAGEHAHKLKHRLEHPGESAVLKDVADALRGFGVPSPLHVAAMRGGIYRDDSWARAPNQPTVCVSTVDQVGSRLLFRGYGVSEFGWPVHAALTGNDALYVVDEAHLSQPFLETLAVVRQFRQAPWASQPLGGPFCVVEVSATPRSREEPFRLTKEDHAHEELRRRFKASKPATLVETDHFEKEAAEWAIRAREGTAKVVGVVVNRVASARDIFSRLPGVDFEDKVLLTGRIRPWDRDQLLSRFLDRVRAGRERQPEDKPLFVIATMTVEVGADLDFDYLVTEAAPFPSLRQRFGRLDRLGRLGQAAGAILLRKQQGPDPIYGEDLANTWEWLRAQTPRNSGAIDFGINALDSLMQEASEPPPAIAPRPGPTLFPAHFDSWVQTSPVPRPTPDVAPYLHGAEALDTADVQLVWRADVLEGGEGEWPEIVAAAPPRSRETLSLPVQAVRNWLSQAGRVEVADIEGTPGQSQRVSNGRKALRWRGPDSDETDVIGSQDIRPGDTLVVPSTYGGADSFGWFPECSEPVSDVGDVCVNEMANAAPNDGLRRLIRLRLYPSVEEQLAPEGPSLNRMVQAVRDLVDAGEDYADALDELLVGLATRPPGHPLMAATVQRLIEVGPRVTAYPAGIVLTARVKSRFFGERVREQEDLGAEDSTDTDDSSALRGGTYQPAPVTLEAHLRGVAAWTRAFVNGLGLDNDLGVALELAARFHDLGKADWRFQFLLHGDEPTDALLAKSGHDLDAQQRRMLRVRAKLPEGFRHELVSVALVRNCGNELLDGVAEEERTLVEHLIGAHHGRGRPFTPFIEEPEPETVRVMWEGHSLEANSDHGLWKLDSDWADVFWQLVRRYGYWGLAYLEAILRLADGARSAEEQREQEERR
jgi:CRISPR-associated endonuclease/helicase Cas3